MISISIIQAKPDDAEAVSALGHRIWQAHYPSIISQEQIDYMLNLWYTPDYLRQCFENEKQRFYLGYLDEVLSGFIAYWPTDEDGVMFISRLYVDLQSHGKGLGSALLEKPANEANIHTLRLHVNRHNVNSINYYQKRGFKPVGEQITEIGEGYVMDDYVMEKSLF